MNKKVIYLIMLIIIFCLFASNIQAAEQTEYVIDQDFIDLINQLATLIWIVILLLTIFVIMLLLICVYLAFITKKYMKEIQNIIRLNSGISGHGGYYQDQYYQQKK